MQFGLDLLGLAHPKWKIKGLVKEFPPGWWVGVFDGVFGNPIVKLQALVDSGKVAGVRAQLEYNNEHILITEKLLRQRAPKWEAFAIANPAIPVVVSPSCEYANTTAKKLEKILLLAKELCPHCEIIQSPGRNKNDKVAVTIPGWRIEEHGHRARTGAEFLSTDGESVYDMCDQRDANRGAAHWIARHKDTAAVCFLWGARFNLREAHNKLPPKGRFAAPHPKYVIGVACHAVAKINPMEGCSVVPAFSYQPMKKPRLYKTFAEDQQGEDDKRGNKPMIMTPEKLSAVELVTFDDQRICRLPRYKDPKPVKVHRYYFPKKYAWELGEIARKKSGCSLAWLKEVVNGKAFYYGPFDPRYRNPFFQIPGKED